MSTQWLDPGAGTRWLRDVSGYQWLVMVVAGGAWLFDNLDQRLFSLARIPALAELMLLPAGDAAVQAWGKNVTAVFLVGWGLGGIVLGIFGDRFGRARVLSVSMLLYALGTAATALSTTAMAFLVLRFLTGIGIGGVFGLAAALIADTFAGSARVAMLAALQILSIVGNIVAALLKIGVEHAASAGLIAQSNSWRLLFALGGLPVLLGIVGLLRLREPPAWRDAQAAEESPRRWLAPLQALLADPRERRHLLIGSLLASAGVVGLWSVGEYAVDLQEAVFRDYYARHADASAVAGLVGAAKGQAYLLQMMGGCIGMLAFVWAANRWGRRPAFVGAFALAFALTVLTYARLETPIDSYWMTPLMGAAQFSVFVGFSLYLPELFAQRARATGISFCYNIGRFAAAAGSLISAQLSTRVFGGFAAPLPLRYSAIAVSLIFLVGIVAALAGPETGGGRQRARAVRQGGSA